MSGTIRPPAGPSGTDAALVPAALAQLRAGNPSIVVSLVMVGPPDSLDLLRRGRGDLALSFGYAGVADGEAKDLSRVPNRAALVRAASAARFGLAIAFATDDHIAVQRLVASPETEIDRGRHVARAALRLISLMSLI